MAALKKELENIENNIRENEEINTLPEATELLEVITPALESPGELSFAHHRKLMEKLQNAIERFEVSHPKLIAQIKVVVNGLNDIGV